MSDAAVASGVASSADKPRPRKPIKLVYKLIYAAPALALAAAGIFHTSWQTKYYVDDLGLGPRLFALCNAIVRSVDLFSYPITGWLVDNTFVDGSKIFTGRRRPFLLICAPIVAAAFFLLYTPPGLGPSAMQAWYCAVAIIYNAVPLTLTYYSLGTEVTSDYDEQSSIFSWVHVLSCAGMVCGALIPGFLASSHVAPHTTLFPAFSLVIALLIAGTFVLLAVQTRVPHPSKRIRDDDGRELPSIHTPTSRLPRQRRGHVAPIAQ